jgi:serine/threonine protein kinase/WD40 repeat protein/Flp pilus assembly protein TadD
VNDENYSSDREPLDDVAEEFIARYRRGERPSLPEYEQNYPELAKELRELIPALVMMEEVRPRAQDIPDHSLQDGTGAGLKLERIGDYRILREVGRGGMGIVYEAEQESLGRHVALKVLPRHALLDPRQLARFRREARAAARLHHTNIVPVFGTGEYDGLHYHVMQFIQGLGLDQVLAEVARLRNEKDPSSRVNGVIASNRTNSNSGAASQSAAAVAQALISGQFHRSNGMFEDAPPTGDRPGESSTRVSGSSSSRIHLPGQGVDTTESGIPYWRSVARIGVQVADALAYANDQGVLHRDIKPSNLLLDTAGTVWVTDFGLAKASESDDLTHTGDIVGTLRYIAPERLHGQADARSDLYSLGITMYELLTLRHPFAESDRNKLVRQISEEEPLRPRSLDRDLPRDLETIVLKAIAKQPCDRYQTASSFAADLRHFLEDKPIEARRVGRTERVWRWVRRNPTISGLAAAVAVLVAVVGVGLLFTHVLFDQRNRAVDAEREARASQERAEKAEQEIKVRSHLAQATAYRNSGRLGQHFQCLEEIAAAVQLHPSQDLRRQLRNEAIAALALSDLRVRVHHPVGHLDGVHFDRQLKRYAFVDLYKDGATIVRRFDDDDELMRAGPPDFSFWHATTDFTPDGQYLLICYFARNTRKFDAVLDVWHVERRERVSRHEIRSGDMIGSVTAVGQQLLFVNRQSELCVWDLARGQEEKRLPLGMIPYSICVDSQRRRVAVNDYTTPLVRILDLATGEELARWSSEVGTRAMAWSSDDQLLAMGNEDGRIFVTQVARGERVSVLEGQVLRLEFAHRGHLLAMSGWDGTTQLWDAASGTKLVEGAGEMVRFSEDDSQLGFFNGRGLGIWDVAHGVESKSLVPPSQQLAASFGPGDRWIAVPGLTGVTLWEWQSAEELCHLPCERAGTVLFSRDGRGLVTNSLGGVSYWPMRREWMGDSEVLHIGPPRLLQELGPSGFAPAAWLPDERTIAVADNSKKCVLLVPLEPSNDAPIITLPSRHGRITNLAVSPDGRWLAAGGWKEAGIQLWNLPDRRLERVLPHSLSQLATIFNVYFSPDNQWLLSAARSDDACSYLGYRVGTWDRGISHLGEFGAHVRAAFSDDRRLMALSTSSKQMLIADPRDGRELLRLTGTHAHSWPVAFSHDGSELVLGSVRGPLTLWNLRHMERALRRLGLAQDDVDGTENAIARSAFEEGNDEDSGRLGAPTGPRLTARVDLGDLAQPRASNGRGLLEELNWAAVYGQTQSWASARAALERAVQLGPDSAFAHNALAWFLATCPDHTFRDGARAVWAGSRAVELEPNNTDYRNSLGVAYYREGKFREAVVELTKSEELAPGRSFAHNAYFLAMAHWRLGDQAAAHKWYAEAVQWSEKNQPTRSQENEELRLFRAEAEGMLGIAVTHEE